MTQCNAERVKKQNGKVFRLLMSTRGFQILATELDDQFQTVSDFSSKIFLDVYFNSQYLVSLRSTEIKKKIVQSQSGTRWKTEEGKQLRTTQKRKRNRANPLRQKKAAAGRKKQSESSVRRPLDGATNQDSLAAAQFSWGEGGRWVTSTCNPYSST